MILEIKHAAVPFFSREITTEFCLQKLCETNKQLFFEFWKTDFTKFFENNSSHRNFSLLTHFWEKFRETNVFTKEITLELISRNIFYIKSVYT